MFPLWPKSISVNPRPTCIPNVHPFLTTFHFSFSGQTPFVAVGSPPSSNVGVQPSGVGDDSAVYPQQPPSGVGDDSAVYLPQSSSGVGDDSEFDVDDTDGRLGTDAAADSSLPPLPVTLSFASPPLLSPPSSSPSSVVDAARRKSVHEFTVKDLDGNDVSLSIYK